MTAAVTDTLGAGRRPLHILISAGPTREPIDAVRFISNYSTGYMGARLAAEALSRGHRVTVVSGPAAEPLPAGARVIPVESAREMDQALRRQAGGADAIIMAAAVSDFRPARAAAGKLHRRSRLTLRLEATPDIVAGLPRRRGQLMAGFAIETDRVLPRAEEKLRGKRLDLLVAQRANGTGSPFGRQQVDAWLLTRRDRPGDRIWRREALIEPLGRCSKGRIARALLDKIEALWYGQRKPTGSPRKA